MAMTSLNISLPEVLKEYIRELIRRDKERRLANLEEDLIAAANGPKIELSVTDLRKKGLVALLRERTRRR